jgi:hypothetical protein
MRLKAMGLAQELQDARLREALTLVLHNDPEPVIRLEALRLLRRDPDTARVQEALLQTLRDDPAVQLRLAALDLLALQQADPDRVRQAIRSVDRAGDQAVMQYAGRLLESP